MTDTISVEIDHAPIVYTQPLNTITVRHECGNVVLFINDKRVQLTTIIAHEVGMVIARAIPNLEPSEIIVLIINKQRIELFPLVAQRVSTALLRKADDADDWQIENRRKLR